MRLLAVLAVLVAVATASPALSQQAPAPSPIESVKARLDQIELKIGRKGLTGDELLEERRNIDPLIDQIREHMQSLDPKLTTAQERLDQLGPKPGDKDPPEAAEVKEQREQLAKAVADIKAQIASGKLLSTRSDQLIDQINERRRKIFTEQLFSRDTQIFQGTFWRGLVPAFQRALRTGGILIEDWSDHILNGPGISALMLAFGVGILGIMALRFAYRWAARALMQRGSDEQGTALYKVLRACLTMMSQALPIILGVGLITTLLQTFNLVLPRAVPLIHAVFVAAIIVGLTRGVMAAVLAPDRPANRLVVMTDTFAKALYWAGRDSGLIIAIGIVLLSINLVLVTPLALTILTTALIAIALCAVAIVWLRRTAPALVLADDGTESEDEPPYGWVRPLLWIVVGTTLIALLTGYIALGAFIATHVAQLILVIILTALLFSLVDAVIDHWTGGETIHSRALAANLGLKPERIALIGSLLSGLARLLLVLGALVIVLMPWGLQYAEFGTPFDDGFLGLRLGDLRLSLTTTMGAVLVLTVGLFLVGTVRNWFEARVLPHTGLDSGLQNSISTLFGYAGIVAVSAFGLKQLGLDLSNFAIVAGALSVGVGFGLQSIVSNFVSGLIVLAERPIRVGDSIAVKGEEGHVKKISVRATEIETAERATVIVPNSELITGVVKNWTYPNTLGRVVIPVRVAYDSDPELVRSELLAAAEEHPLVLDNPPPRVLLLKFADTGLEFELRCICADVTQALFLRSDLHFAVLSRFRAKGIIISPPLQNSQAPQDP